MVDEDPKEESKEYLLQRASELQQFLIVRGNIKPLFDLPTFLAFSESDREKFPFKNKE